MSLKTASGRGGVVGVVLFILCAGWAMLLTSPELIDLHRQTIQIIWPGFAFTVTGFVIGIIEAYVYGLIGGSVLAWIVKIRRS